MEESFVTEPSLETKKQQLVKTLIVTSGVVLIILLLTLAILLFRPKNRPSDKTSITPTPTVEKDVVIGPTESYIGISPGVTPVDEFDEKLYEKITQEDLIENPDVVVANNTPYEGEGFTVTTEFVKLSEESGYYKIIATNGYLDPQQLEPTVKNWLKTLELKDAAIAKLEIEYRFLNVSDQESMFLTR